MRPFARRTRRRADPDRPGAEQRCSPPSELVGRRTRPRRGGTLPAVDIVLISHDYYDHLGLRDHHRDRAAARPEVTFVAPVGAGAHLLAWGIAADRIRQADWGRR